MASPLGGSITKKSDAESDSWKCSQEVSGVRGKQKMTDSPNKTPVEDQRKKAT